MLLVLLPANAVLYLSDMQVLAAELCNADQHIEATSDSSGVCLPMAPCLDQDVRSRGSKERPPTNATYFGGHFR